MCKVEKEKSINKLARLVRNKNMDINTFLH